MPPPADRQDRSRYPALDRRGEAPGRRAGAPSRQSKVRKDRTPASYEPQRQTYGQPKTRDILPMPTVAWQMAPLCSGKVSYNEARRLSPAFRRDELNLGIAQSPSRGPLT